MAEMMDADSELIQEQSRAIKGLFNARGVLQMFPSFLAEGGCWRKGLVDQELVLERLCQILWGVMEKEQPLQKEQPALLGSQLQRFPSLCFRINRTEWKEQGELPGEEQEEPCMERGMVTE